MKTLLLAVISLLVICSMLRRPEVDAAEDAHRAIGDSRTN